MKWRNLQSLYNIIAISEAEVIKEKSKPAPAKKGMDVNEITVCNLAILLYSDSSITWKNTVYRAWSF